MFNSGDQVGPYTLVKTIGKGAFGVVWLAERRSSIAITKTALKFPSEIDVDLDAIRREADVWVRASGHPNVLPIVEADIYDGQVVIASEYAPDGSMESWLELNDGKSPTIGTAVEMISGVLAGLEHLHSQNIVHRDIKPANILLQKGIPRLADFGISRVLKSTSQSLNIAGTPLYMAPEAFANKRSEQTDLWAVGVILYLLLSGRLPFSENDLPSLMASISGRDPEPLPATISGSLKEIVARLLEKDPIRRLGSASEARNALRALRHPMDTDETIENEIKDPLAEIRKQMLTSNSLWQLRESAYKLEEFLTRRPQHPEARMMHDQIMNAIRREESVLIPQPQFRTTTFALQEQKAKSAGLPLLFLIGFGLLLLLLFLVYQWLY